MVWAELVTTSDYHIKETKGVAMLKGAWEEYVEAIPSYNHTHAIEEQLAPSTSLLHSKYI